VRWLSAGASLTHSRGLPSASSRARPIRQVWEAPDEDACRQYLFESRWPEGFRCPRCGSKAATGLPQRLLWQCSACRYQVSVTAGTVLHRTRTPLDLWFWAAYLVTTGLRT